MYKLTVEFKNNEELAAFVIKLGGLPAQADVKHIQPVVVEQESQPVEQVKEEPKKEKKIKKKETIVDQGVEVEVPPVIEKPAIDRDAVIKIVTQSIKDLTDLGLQGADIAAALADIYVKTGCPAGVKISMLTDDQLEQFFPLFQKFVADKKKQTVVTAQTQSFV
jgi:hypothetical protein